MQPHHPGPVHELGQGLDQQPMSGNGDPGVGAGQQRPGIGENVDFRVGGLVIGIHQVQLHAGHQCGPGPANQKSVPGLSQLAVGSPPGSGLLDRERAGHRPGGLNHHAASRGLGEHLASGGRLAAGRHSAGPGGGGPIAVRVSTPGRVRVASGAPAAALPAADRRVTTACPAAGRGRYPRETR